MKICPKCGNSFDDEYEFCLNDGMRLQYSLVSEATVVVPLASAGTASSAAATKPPYVLIGIIFLLSLVAVGFAVAYFISGSKNSTANANMTPQASPSPTNATVSANSTPVVSDPALLAENERLRREIERQKQADRAAQPPEPAASGRLAYVHAPPSHVRAAPTTSSAIQCTIRSRSDIRVYGSTGIRDGNGVWFHTDACSRPGYIHSTQFR